MWGWRAGSVVAVALMAARSAIAADYLTGSALFDDVAHYASFGSHRFGSAGDRATADWISGELTAAGYKVEFQPVVLS